MRSLATSSEKSVSLSRAPLALAGESGACAFYSQLMSLSGDCYEDITLSQDFLRYKGILMAVSAILWRFLPQTSFALLGQQSGLRSKLGGRQPVNPFEFPLEVASIPYSDADHDLFNAHEGKL